MQGFIEIHAHVKITPKKSHDVIFQLIYGFVAFFSRVSKKAKILANG